MFKLVLHVAKVQNIIQNVMTLLLLQAKIIKLTTLLCYEISTFMASFFAI